MKLAIDLPASVTSGAIDIVVIRNGDLRLSEGPRIVASAHDPDLALDDEIVMWIRGHDALLIGLKAPTLWHLDMLAGTVMPAARLERLDLRNRYDPGGLHWLDFQDIDGDDVLVAFEIGLARAGRSGKLRWQTVHGDTTVTVSRLEGPLAILESDEGELALRLSDGSIRSVR